MKIATTLGLGLALSAAAGLIALPASAMPATGTGDYGSGGVNIRSGPHTSNSINGIGYPGDGASVNCWVTGDDVNGNTVWLYNRDLSTGVTGYSAAAYMVWTGTASHC